MRKAMLARDMSVWERLHISPGEGERDSLRPLDHQLAYVDESVFMSEAHLGWQ